MHTMTLLLCVFILWTSPSRPGDAPARPLRTYATLAECRTHEEPVEANGRVYYYDCFPDTINPNQR